MWQLSVFIGIVIFLCVLLMIRTSYINTRLNDIEDYLTDCVTKDRLKELVVTHIQGALEE